MIPPITPWVRAVVISVAGGNAICRRPSYFCSEHIIIIVHEYTSSLGKGEGGVRAAEVGGMYKTSPRSADKRSIKLSPKRSRQGSEGVKGDSATDNAAKRRPWRVESLQ